jgi:hypothetical protein
MEMTVVVGISIVVLAIAWGLIEDATKTSLFLESHNDLAVMSQIAANAIQREVFQAHTIFSDDAVGNGYRAALQLTRAPISGTLLPVINPQGTFSQDEDDVRQTGNALLIARQLPPVVIANFDHDDDGSTAAINFYADRYRFQYFYQSVSDPRVTFPLPRRDGGSLDAYDLLQASTGIYADYSQLASGGLSGSQRRDICTKLAALAGADELSGLWSPGQPVGNAFYDVADCTDGSFAGDAPWSSPVAIGVGSTRSVIPGLLGGRIFGGLRYTVARHRPANRPWPETENLWLGDPSPEDEPSERYLLPRFARPDDFLPSGFEVKVVGPAGLRRTMVRVVLLSNYGTLNRYDAQEAITITSSRF